MIFKDSIDRSLNSFRNQKSLPYSFGDNTFLITKYHKDDQTVVIVEQENIGKYGSQEKRYYLKNGRLILYTEYREYYAPGTSHYTAGRAFYDNGKQFFAEMKKGTDKRELANTPFQMSKLKIDVKKDLQRYEDALNQSGEFDLAFTGIVESPKTRYLVLGQNDITHYRAYFLIRKEDVFVRELINNPTSYRGRRLKMRWQKQGREYVYVSAGFR